MPVNYFKNIEDFVEFKAGDVIFDENQPGDVMYAVKEGEVDILHNGHVLETCTADQFFGEMALIDKSNRAASAVAKTDCKLITVDKKRFLFLVQETPTFALQVMHEMAERLRRMTNLVDLVDVKPAE
jgi:CRP/FNR family transcriptional regulator, cyclic AMP receptor protein